MNKSPLSRHLHLSSTVSPTLYSARAMFLVTHVIVFTYFVVFSATYIHVCTKIFFIVFTCFLFVCIPKNCSNFCDYNIKQDFLKSGFVVQVVSKVCGRSLRVLENGALDCAGESGTACESEISCRLCSCE